MPACVIVLQILQWQSVGVVPLRCHPRAKLMILRAKPVTRHEYIVAVR